MFNCFGVEYCCDRKSHKYVMITFCSFPQDRLIRQVQPRRDGAKMCSTDKLVRHDRYPKLTHAQAAPPVAHSLPLQSSTVPRAPPDCLLRLAKQKCPLFAEGGEDLWILYSYLLKALPTLPFIFLKILQGSFGALCSVRHCELAAGLLSSSSSR